MIAIGVNEKKRGGWYREILDIEINHEESNASYEAFFDILKERGVKKVDLIVLDGHKGIKRAAAHSFISSSWQLCTVHFKRNLLKVVPKKDTKIILEDINMILKSKTLQDAIEYANGLSSAYEESHPKLLFHQ